MRTKMHAIAMVLMLAAAPCAAAAAEPAVPAVMGFHAALTDEGGNPLADGEVAAAFRITDAAGTILYEEHQRVSSVGGQVAALIGNGLTGEGAPTGGVPIELLDPRDGRYLQVEVAGMAPLPLMELATVPYAAYAQEALGVAKGGIAFEDLSGAAVDELGRSLTRGLGAASIVVREELSAPPAAATIGVASGFSYSTATDLQGVLGDLDRAIAGREAQITAEAGARDAAVAAESSARASADAAVNAAITDEAAKRSGADAELGSRLQAVENPARLSFGRSAWGTVDADGGFHGQNATVVKEGTGVYRISFVQPLSSASYAAVVTPANDQKINDSSAAPLVISNKTADGFTVGTGLMATPSFDFIVMGW